MSLWGRQTGRGGTPGHILIGYIAHSPAYRRSLPPTHTLPDIYHTHTQYERERIYTARRFSNPPRAGLCTSWVPGSLEAATARPRCASGRIKDTGSLMCVGLAQPINWFPAHSSARTCVWAHAYCCCLQGSLPPPTSIFLSLISTSLHLQTSLITHCLHI